MKNNSLIRNILVVSAVILLVLTFPGGFAFADDSIGAAIAEREDAVDKTVSDRSDVSDAVVSLEPGKAVYSGTALVPKVSVILDGKILAEDVDYSVTMPEMKDANSYEISVTGQGSYTGHTTVNFVVQPVDVGGAIISVARDFETADLTEDRTAVKESVLASITNVMLDNKDISSWCTLTSKVSGEQVTITAATVNADGVNVIEGSVSSDFTLKTSMSDCKVAAITPVVYSGSAHTPTVAVKNVKTGAVLKQGGDYIISYNNNVDAGTAEIIITGRNTYTGELKTDFEIQPKDIFYCTAFYTNGRSSSAYIDAPVIPAITVQDGYQTILVQDKDFHIFYTKADGTTVPYIKNAGDYKVIVGGIGNYKGKLTLNYKVGGTDISGYTVTLKQTKVKADGTIKVPIINSVKLGTKSSLSATDYDVTYLDESGQPVEQMINPGKYTIVINGKSSYGGSTSTTFEIVGQDQGLALAKTSYKVYKKSKDFTIVPESDNPDVVYTFESSDPDVASVDENGVVNVHKLGRAKITVTASGSSIYNSASKNVFVKVYPYKAVLTRKPWTEGARKSFRVRWETQADVTYYQVRYSTTKTFKSGTYKTKKVNASSKNYATQSTKISGLKSGKTYYVKVRAVKVAYNDAGNKVYYYGNWSGWRSVKAK